MREVSLMLPKVALLQNNSNIQIREIVYKNFMWCFDHFRLVKEIWKFQKSFFVYKKFVFIVVLSLLFENLLFHVKSC